MARAAAGHSGVYGAGAPQAPARNRTARAAWRARTCSTKGSRPSKAAVNVKGHDGVTHAGQSGTWVGCISGRRHGAIDTPKQPSGGGARQAAVMAEGP